MRRFWKWVWRVITYLPRKAGKFIKTRPLFCLGFIFSWIVPIVLLNNEFVLLKHIDVGYKITFVGCMVLLVIILAIRKKINIGIQKIKNHITREVLNTIYKAITYGVVFGILWGITMIGGRLLDWWQMSGISFLFAVICFIWDAVIREKKTTLINNQEENTTNE